MRGLLSVAASYWTFLGVALGNHLPLECRLMIRMQAKPTTCMMEKKHQIEAASCLLGVIQSAMKGPVAKRIIPAILKGTAHIGN